MADSTINLFEADKLTAYFILVNDLYKAFDNVWESNKWYNRLSRVSSLYALDTTDTVIRLVLKAMCLQDDWYLWDKYADTVGGNWTRSLYELIGMFIRIKVGE